MQTTNNRHDKNLFYTNLTQNFLTYCTAYLYGGCSFYEQPSDIPPTFPRTDHEDDMKKDDDNKNHNNDLRHHGDVGSLISSSSINANHNRFQSTKEQEGNVSQQLPFVVLLKPESMDKSSGQEESIASSTQQDVWTSNAIRLYSSLCQIMSVLDCHSSEYTYKDVIFSKTSKDPTNNNGQQSRMKEEEVAVFEASIASFITSAASQIDTLRQSMIQEENICLLNHGAMSEDVKAHRSGVISHLVCELEQLMRDFQAIQKQRNRVELELYLDPLKCVYYNYHASSVARSDEDDDDDLQRDWELHLEPDDDYLDILEREEERFQSMFGFQNDQEWRDILHESLPLFPTNTIVRDDANKGQESKDMVKNHNSIGLDREVPSGESEEADFSIHQQGGKNRLHHHENGEIGEGTVGPLSVEDDDTNMRQTEILQQEEIFLNTTVQNTDLDAAQSIESQMMQITSLLSQFSSLISEQQEEIQLIADSSANSRINVTKGREKLIQATEQKKKSRHYFAWIIFMLGLLLLFLNSIIT